MQWMSVISVAYFITVCISGICGRYMFIYDTIICSCTMTSSFFVNKIILSYAKRAYLWNVICLCCLRLRFARIQLEYNTGTVLPIKNISDYCLLLSKENWINGNWFTYLSKSHHLASLKPSLCNNTNWGWGQYTQQVISSGLKIMFSLKYTPKTSYFCRQVLRSLYECG